MQTKLVYVLTCAPEATYIEQALIAIWSARYHNPDAHIVLLTDNLTDKLLSGTRGELLQYISEKIIIPFEDDKNVHYRSRWLKTSVRRLIEGDYLFIDCDTIVTCDLSHVEAIDAQIAMVRDENVDIADEDFAAAKPMIDNCNVIGLDVTKETYYFNSGVMYVKDTPLAHKLYDRWHELWQDGVTRGITLDQPTFAKANVDCGRPVVLLEDKWNTIVQSQIEEVYSAYILHFWHSVSFLFDKNVMMYLRENGLSDTIKYYILHPTETFLPSDNHIYHYKAKDYWRFFKLLRRTLKTYGKYVDASFSETHKCLPYAKYVKPLLQSKCFCLAALLVVMAKLYRVRFSSKYKHYTNYYAKR